MARKILFILLICLLASGSATAQVIKARHELSVELYPKERTLTGSDRIELELGGDPALLFFLAPGADIKSLEIDGGVVDYEFADGRLNIELPAHKRNGKAVLSIEYRASFNDPYEPEPFAMDNPGQGVTGTMNDEAVFLLGGSGWYPLVNTEQESISLTVRAPAGMFAVTGGRVTAQEAHSEESVSGFEIERAESPQALFAGRYMVSSEPAGHVRVYTYFLEPTERLSARYLEAAKRHLEFFQDLLGEYLFPKFAVVENFFPTGYGFPSFTLLGTRVLNLPFIPDTSLRHEIAHCWWGNGVLVDYGQGNWSEGLTTYVSEHLGKELESDAEARKYRLRVLTDYSLLAAGDNDFPLSRFYSRDSPATQAVGYGKAMFVFHMARIRVGDENFWKALKDVYKRFSFKPASWSDFRQALVRASDWPEAEAEAFFDQWVGRAGAPELSIKEAETGQEDGVWRTTAVIGQSEPHFILDVPVRVTDEKGGQATRTLRLEGASAKVEIETGARPAYLAVDPDVNVFRRLYPEEIPPNVNSVKGSENLAAVFCAGLDQRLTDLFRGLLIGLNHPGIEIMDEAGIDPAGLAGRDLIFFGYPSTDKGKALAGPLPSGIRIEGGSFDAGGEFSSEKADSAFIAFKDPSSPARIKSFFLFDPGLPAELVERTVRKIPHYGNYGLLAFKRSENQGKDSLSPEASPLRLKLED